MEDKIREVMGEILEVDPERITESFGPGDAEAWDSLANLRMVTALEEAFGIKLTMAQIGSMGTFSKIRDILAANTADV